jgi:DNA-binding transcriptional LysR family regulator
MLAAAPAAVSSSSVPRRYLRHGTLPQLAAFEAVVRLGSVTRAADALCMAQPTLSGHLRKLSESLDVQLFELQGKRLVPTQAAAVLLQGAHEVFDAIARCDRMLADIRSAALRLKG